MYTLIIMLLILTLYSIIESVNLIKILKEIIRSKSKKVEIKAENEKKKEPYYVFKYKVMKY